MKVSKIILKTADIIFTIGSMLLCFLLLSS